MFELAIKRGVALLNKKLPGWEHRINTKILDIGCPCSCILGQLFGFFGKGLAILGINSLDFDSDPATYGFSLRYNNRQWDKLTYEWIKTIEDLRKREATTNTNISTITLLTNTVSNRTISIFLLSNDTLNDKVKEEVIEPCKKPALYLIT